jgi:Phosphotransferase enzyme family
MIQPDTSLPGFSRCFDMAFMRDALESALPSLGVVRSCCLERFRYRKQTRASFLYEVQTGAGREWVSGSLHKSKKSLRIFKAAESDAATGYVSDVDMVLERFPHDRKLGFASDLAAGRYHAVLDALAPLLDRDPLDVIEVVPIRYRPRIAAVFRIAVRGANLTQRFYVKIYADEDVQAIRFRLQGIRDADQFSILKPVALLERHNAVIWPEVNGVSLASDNALNAVGQGARALATFHQSSQNLPSISPQQHAQDAAERHATFIASVMPDVSCLTDVLKRDIPKPFATTPLGPFHHDMKPEHALVSDNITNFIDVEGIALGDPAFDVGNMLARLSAGAWLYGVTETHSEQAVGQFLENSSRLPRDRCSAAFALGQMKLATYAISHQIADWENISTSQLERAVAVLNTKSFS